MSAEQLFDGDFADATDSPYFGSLWMAEVLNARSTVRNMYWDIGRKAATNMEEVAGSADQF